MAKRSRSKEHVRRYVALDYQMLRSEAWRSLDCVERAAYVAIKSRYSGGNNGKIPFSLLELARELNVSKATALRAVRGLQEKGFIAVAKLGGFNVKVREKGIRAATEWRLTEHSCNVTGRLPTNDFLAWRAAKKQNTVSPENPDGYPDETARVS
jgi:predicted ArsR family transcriptional regulator